MRLLNLLFFILIVCFMVTSCSGMGFGAASLTEASKNQSCADSIQTSLRIFKEEMHMPFQIAPDDYEMVFNSGEIEKSYYRDGIGLTVSFNLSKTEEGCLLKFFKRSENQPGRYTSTKGNYGTILLVHCECE